MKKEKRTFSKSEIQVWDLFVRIFHWSLVAGVIIQLVTAEAFNSVHVKVGILIVVLLVLRIIWGFVGSIHARFADFSYSPKEVITYLKGLLKGRPEHYIGHNPAGGVMVFAMLFVLALTTVTGLLTYGAKSNGALSLLPMKLVSDASADENHEGKNSLSHPEIDAQMHQKQTSAREKAHFWKEIHEFAGGIIIFLVILHVCGVIASSYLHKENLILAMITGNKKSK
jgi:cytochrome b